MANNYHSLLSVVSKVAEKLLNDRLIDCLKKCGLFFLFPVGSRSSWSTADLLTIGSDRITGTTLAVMLDITKVFDRLWDADLLHISSQVFGLILSFLSERLLQVVLDGKCLQEYAVNAGVLQGSVLGTTLFLLCINDLPYEVICKIAI